MKKRFLILLYLTVAGLLNVQAEIIDVTDSIKNNNFTGDVAVWTAERNAYNQFKQASGAFEAWNGDNASSWFNLSQEITVPAGVYRLTVNAYHRGYLVDVTNAVLYGTTATKEYSVGVKSLKAEQDAYGSAPSTIIAAKAAFDAGYWLNTVENIVVSDEGNGKGKLKVGIRNVAQLVRATTATTGDIWTIWSNFRLFQLTGADLDPMRDAVVAKASALLTMPTDYVDGGVLAAEIATLTAVADASLTLTAIQGLEAAMQTYRANRYAAGSLVNPADVSYLIRNAGFEEGQRSLLGTANGHYNEPIGWKLTYNTASTHVNNNVSIINNKVVPAGVAAGVVITPTEGSYSHVSRFRWTTNESYTISQTVRNLRPGKYKISADLGKLSVNGNAVLKAVVAGAEVMNKTAAFVAGPAFTSVDAIYDALTGDSLVISATMTQVGGEATLILDNIRLEYMGEVPFVSVNKNTLNFTPSVREHVLNLRAGNISGTVELTPTSAFTLSRTSIPAAELMLPAGVDITVTALGNADVAGDSLILSNSTIREKVELNLIEGAINVSNYGLFFDQTYSPALPITVMGDFYDGLALTAPTGISLSDYSISKAEALAGKAISVTWDGATKVEDLQIYITTGVKKDSVNVFAVAANLISGWDGDAKEGDGSKLTDLGWSLTNATGVAVAGSFNNYNAASGIRLVPIITQNYLYKGKPWIGHRVAYLRTWGNPAANVYNLEVALDAGKEYSFRGVSTWHDNENNPTFTYAVNTAKSNLGDTLGIQLYAHTVKRVGADFGFSFTPSTDGVHYLTVSSNTINDVMATPMYLAIYQSKDVNTAADAQQGVEPRVYPTLASGSVQVASSGNQGTVKVFDATGKLVHIQTLNAPLVTLQLPVAGMYFVNVQDGEKNVTVKTVNSL